MRKSYSTSWPALILVSHLLTHMVSFKHYFDDADSDTTHKMYSGIQTGSSGDHGNAFQLKFIITCKETDDCKDSLALTDAKPNNDHFTARLRLCPKFFTDDHTKNNLASREYKRNPGRRDNSWCKPHQPFTFFETAAHTFLHEMTHLNQLGMEAGLFPDHEGEDAMHGTEDIYQVSSGYDPGSPEKSARKLKDNWVKYKDHKKNKKNKKPDLQRTENAESYAAAATEFWFQSRCGWDKILE